LPPPAPPCHLELTDSAAVLGLSGDWRLAELTALSDALAQRELARIGGRPLVVDGAALTSLDTAGALLFLRRVVQAGADPATIELRNFDPRHVRIVEVVRERLGGIGTPRAKSSRSPVAAFGAHLVDIGRLAATHVGFLGLTLAALASLVRSPGSLRGRELLAQLGQTCVTAIPVVSLVMFLIGVVVAYLLGLQAAQYGANIFVVDGVALGMVREFSPLLVATVIAGRSGAAFTAQLGTMKLTEEIDAIRTLGLSPEQVLLVPRVIALVIALPILVFVGSVTGLAGAAVVCSVMLDITPATFIERLHDSLPAQHYLIGLAKAPVFALLIAVIGCSMGLTVSRDTRAIGIHTTSTVVQSIVVVILLDAFFAVLFQELDW
jgi:phospholipid/cholesterol/gamma-HCH transport system permease protein